MTDPRIARSRRLVREAALAELAEVGYGGMRIEAIAKRAGVGKSTVYRLWGDKVTLIADALETLNEQPAPTVLDGSARERLEVVLRHLAEALRDSAFSRHVPALVDAAEHDQAVRTFYHEYSARRRHTVVRILHDGVRGGEFPADLDPDMASIALAGAVFYRRLVTDEPFQPDQVGHLIDTVLPR